MGYQQKSNINLTIPHTRSYRSMKHTRHNRRNYPYIDTVQNTSHRETLLITKLRDLSAKENSDSIQSFVANEQVIENKELRDNYERTMERMVFLEEHLKTIGAEVPADQFWDSK